MKSPFERFFQLKLQPQKKPTNYSSPKPFVYLTQTEQCLPSNFASYSEIGDPETCNCNVIVLSFRNKCKVEKSPRERDEMCCILLL